MPLHTIVLQVQTLNVHSPILLVAGNDPHNRPGLEVGKGGEPLEDYLNGLEENSGYRVLSVSAIDPTRILLTLRDGSAPGSER